MERYMLTTIDNPYNPFIQFDEWNSYDISKGYRTNELIAKFSLTSNGLSDSDNDMEIDEAMNKLISMNDILIPSRQYYKLKEGHDLIKI